MAGLNTLHWVAAANEWLACDRMGVDEGLGHTSSAVAQHVQPLPPGAALCWQAGNNLLKWSKHCVTLQSTTITLQS